MHGLNPLPTNEAMGIYMGGLTLDANTLYVDICIFKPFLHT